MAMASPQRKWFKGPAAVAIDTWYADGDVRQNLNRADGYLRQVTLDFAAILADLRTTGNVRVLGAFQYPLGVGALQGTEFEAVTRQGYREAIGLALGHSPPVPIKTFWMTGAGNDHFEMHVSDETQHVSVTLLVPGVDGGDQDGPEAWAVRIGADGQPHAEQTSGPANARAPSARGLATG